MILELRVIPNKVISSVNPHHDDDDGDDNDDDEDDNDDDYNQRCQTCSSLQP